MEFKEISLDTSFETELGPSELGTQEYWDARYKDEVKNFKDFGDVGEIWFGEDIVDRIVKWMNKNEQVQKSDRILDVGCGNGMLLVELANEGYENLFGVDYCEGAVELAKSIAAKSDVKVNYQVMDVLKKDDSLGTFKWALDKGTYDAISLMPYGEEMRKLYIENVHSLLDYKGTLIMTSCNWTNEEIVRHFSHKFLAVSEIPTPHFKFGGSEGNLVSIVILQKK